MKKIIISAIVVLGIAFSLMVNTSKSVLAFEPTVQSEPKDKVIFEGFNLNQSASTDEIQEEVTETGSDIVTVQVQLDYQLLSDARYQINRRTNMNYFIAEQRRLSKEYHTRMNQYLSQELGLEGYEDSYLSSYSPFIDYHFEKDVFVENADTIVGELVDSEYVSTAYIQNTEEYTPSNINTAMFTTGTYEPVYLGEVSGAGVTIGILEIDGIVDKKHPNIIGSDITVRNEWWFNETISGHATQVASVLGGNTGVAKGAKLLSVQLAGSPSEEIDWLLDRGVNIINLSFGETEGNANGIYSSQSAYMDYVVRTNFVTIVAAAGNFGGTHGNVGNPGLGYNVITVGATNLTGTYKEDYSSYNVVKGPSKPNIVGPTGLRIPNYNMTLTGTSFSAPVVAGSIALLMEKYPDLKAFPEKVLAVVASSAKFMSMHSTFGIEGYNNEVGSGLFDYTEIVDNMSNTFAYINSIGTSGIYREMYVYVEYGKTLKASVAWLLNSNNTLTIKLTDYDLRMFDPTGRPVASATSTHNNIEVVSHYVTMPGYYKLQVMQNGALANGRDWVSLSYSIR